MAGNGDFNRRLHELLSGAMALDAEARRGFIDRECVDDPVLMRRVLELLDLPDRSAVFIDRPAMGVSAAPAGWDTEAGWDQIPDAVGNYLVLGVLGVGGMATVYEALQEDPKRSVALKVMHRGMTTPEAFVRFRFETEALAMLQHPGIAQIYEAGAAQLGQAGPVPFFAMELIPGATTITEFARRGSMSVRDRVRMFISVCDAVHHGHQHGIIHRDLKPGNVLVDTEGRPRVIDFGVARTTEKNAAALTAISDVRQIIGTLNYMSPEQCESGADIDIRTDVYSLGVILHELVFDRLPHDLSDLPLPAAIQRIVHDPVARCASGRSRDLRDLDAVIRRAMEKDPGDRYESAAGLSSDLRRFLGFQTIEARAPSVLNYCALFTRRHRSLVLSALSVLVSILVVMTVSTWFAVRLSNEVKRRRVAEIEILRERDVARWEAYTAQIAGALSAIKTGEFQQIRTRLAATSMRLRGWEWGFLSRLAERSAATVVAHDDMILDLAVNRDATRYATGASDGSVRLWEAGSGVMLASFQSGSGDRIFSVAFSSDDRTILCGDDGGKVRVLDADDLHEIGMLAELPRSVRCVVVVDEHRAVAATVDGVSVLMTLEPRGVTPLMEDPARRVHGMCVSSDRRRIAVYNNEGSIWIQDTEGFRDLVRLEFPGLINQARFSADGTMIAAVGASNRVFVWSTVDGTVLNELVATQGVNTVRTVAFSHDGSLLAAGLTHRGILVFSLDSGQIVGTLDGHTDAVSAVGFSPDDSRLVSSSWDRTIRTWMTDEFSSPGGITTLRGHEGHVLGVAFSPDGSVVSSVSRDGSVRMWDPDLGQEIARVDLDHGTLGAIAYSPDGRLIAVACTDRTVQIIDAKSGQVVYSLHGHGSWVSSVGFDAWGERVIAGANNGDIRVWDLKTQEEVLLIKGHEGRINSACFSPDGVTIASGSRDKTVRLWDAQSGEQRACFRDHTSDVFAVLFSQDGRRLYSGSRDQSVRVWDVESCTPVASLEGHGQYVTCLALNPDGTRLAAGSWFGEIVLFDVDSGDMIASFRAHDSAVRGIAFSPDGRWLASGSYDSTVRLFDSVSREEAMAAKAMALDGGSKTSVDE